MGKDNLNIYGDTAACKFMFANRANASQFVRVRLVGRGGQEL